MVYIYNCIYFFVAIKLLIKLKKGDKVFLFEYLLKGRNQYIVAKTLRIFKRSKIKIFGLAHLTPLKLESQFSDNELKKYSKVLDYYMTLGSSLTQYLINRGIHKDKIITTFHYVDTNYYSPSNIKKVNDKTSVIVMGLQMRDFNVLREIAQSCPDVDFTICKWLTNIDDHFKNCSNVIIKGFMPEDELKAEMEKADISLNAMIDTVGSNVITTSMTMGLAMLVSDVGSIRDYCDETNAIFCNDVEDFKNALLKLSSDKMLINKMGVSSIKKSTVLSINHFYRFINSI
jgi:glycosyltransferase involved in cell wall biosynthesis